MSDLNVIARRLASLIEPIVGQVYFSPECHAEYEALGFDPSPGKAGEVAKTKVLETYFRGAKVYQRP